MFLFLRQVNNVISTNVFNLELWIDMYLVPMCSPQCASHKPLTAMQHISVECLVCETVSLTDQTELHLTIPLEVETDN